VQKKRRRRRRGKQHTTTQIITTFAAVLFEKGHREFFLAIMKMKKCKGNWSCKKNS